MPEVSPILPIRLIDSGIKAGRLQIAYGQALADLHAAGKVPDTLRFLRFHPTVVIGRHQAVAHEIKVEDCFADIVDIVRRNTGGGAIYLDQDQVGWELVLSRRRLPMALLGADAKAIGEAVAFGLSTAFGIDAHVRSGKAIEVQGRRLADSGAFFASDTLICQGTVLVDGDPARAMTYLNAPEAGLTNSAHASAPRGPVTLAELLGQAPSLDTVRAAISKGFEDKLGLACMSGEFSTEEHSLARDYHDVEIGTDGFVFSIDDPRHPEAREASLTGAGGTITAFLRVEGMGDAARIRECVITGDFRVLPPRLILDLEAVLRGVPTVDADAAVQAFFATAKLALLTVPADDFAKVVATAATISRT